MQVKAVVKKGFQWEGDYELYLKVFRRSRYYFSLNVMRVEASSTQAPIKVKDPLSSNGVQVEAVVKKGFHSEGDCEPDSSVYRRRRRSISLCFPDAPQTEAVVGRIFPGLKLFGAFSLNWSVAVSAVVTPQFIGLQRVYLEPIGHSAQSTTIPTVTRSRSSATALRGAALPCRSRPSFFTLLLRLFWSPLFILM